MMMTHLKIYLYDALQIYRRLKIKIIRNYEDTDDDE